MRITTWTVWRQFALAAVIAVAVLLVFRFRQFVLPPPPGYCVALLGLLAVVMTFVLPKEPSRTQKAAWIGAAFALIAVEMWAISRDRQESQSKFDATMQRSDRLLSLQSRALAEVSENINTLTGGDSFIFLSRGFSPKQGYLFFIPVGKYPLYDVSARIHETQKPISSDLFGNLFGSTIGLGDVIPQNGALVRPFPPWLSRSDEINMNIFFSARNGTWTELLRVHPADGAHAIRIFGRFDSQEKEKIICETISPGFPLDDPDGLGTPTVPRPPKCE